MSFESSYANGQLAALLRYKVAWPAATHPVVRESPLLRAAPSTPPPVGGDASKPRMTPQTLARQFDDVEQGETRIEPLRKLSGHDLCTTCRKEKHYGPCKRPIAIPLKRANFNMGMTGDDSSTVDGPATSPHYTSATSSTSALTRAQEGRPADEQARTGFAALFRSGLGDLMSNEPGRMTGALAKVSSLPAVFQSEAGPFLESGLASALRKRHLAGARAAQVLATTPQPLTAAQSTGVAQLVGRGQQMRDLANSYSGVGKGLADAIRRGKLGAEKRGPSVDPYAERPTRGVPPAGGVGEDTDRAWRSFDNVVDSTSIDGGSGTPTGGPAA